MSDKLIKIENPLVLISSAIEKGIDVDKFQQLFELQQRWEEKQALKAFNEAYSKWLSQKPEVKKTKEVKYRMKSGGEKKYKYAPLPEIQKAVDPVLSKLGLSYRFKQTQEGANITITCILSHVDGHSVESPLSAPMDTSGSKNAIQSAGSTVTYLQRYTLVPLLGINVEDDDDGQGGAPVQPTPPPTPTPPTKKVKAKLSEELLDKVLNKIQNGEKDILKKTQEVYDITGKQHEIILNAELNYSK
jgi:hypothetical protein